MDQNANKNLILFFPLVIGPPHNAPSSPTPDTATASAPKLQRNEIRPSPSEIIEKSTSYTIYMCEVPINLLVFFSYYFSYISNSYTSYLRGVTLHSCHSWYGPWCITFSEGDHYDPGQTYEQKKGKGKEKEKGKGKEKTILSFPDGQFIFSKYR
jgi:hypothetical protein